MKKIFLCYLMACFAVQAFAKTPTVQPAAPRAPGSTYEKLAAGEPLLIGVRASSAPLSYWDDETHSYMGLAVDLCLKAVENAKQRFPNLEYKLVEVTSSNRIDYLKEGRIDLECGSTTNTAKRRSEVNFTTPYYFASVVAIKLKTNPLKSISDVDSNTTIIYTKNTSTEQAIAKQSLVFKFKAQDKAFKTILGKDHQQSFDILSRSGCETCIFANDDILLIGLKQRSSDPSKYEFLQESYSVEPYAVMSRKDDKWITTIADKTIVDLMKSHEFEKMYKKWFMQPIPPYGKSLDIPMSARLKDTIRMPTNVVGN